MSKSNIKMIVNPAAGGGAVDRTWPHIFKKLTDSGVLFDYEFTTRVGHAMEMARRSALDGYAVVVAVGGDGTVNEVANGILDSGSIDTALGVVSAGTAHAFALSVGMTQGSFNARPWFDAYETALIDVGVVQCHRYGELVRRFFVNEASLGFSAEMVETWERLPRRLGRCTSLALRTLCAYGAFVTHHNAKVRLLMDGREESSRSACVVVANGQYIADGIRIATRAALDDGLLDVLIFGDLTKAEILRMKSRLYGGDLHDHRAVMERKVRSVSVRSEEHLPVETDGEAVGESPASFQVVPSALRVAVPRAAATGVD